MPPPTKKSKLSSLAGSELEFLYNSLRKLQQDIVFIDDIGGDLNELPLGMQFDSIISQLGAKLKEPESFAFSSMTDKTLLTLKIKFSGILSLKPDFQERIAPTTCLGKDELWSSENLYRHLLVLEKLISRKTESCTRAWIDAFFL